jgi:hypothetical protein
MDEIKKFETRVRQESHKYCSICRGVSINMQYAKGFSKGHQPVCTVCYTKKMTEAIMDSILPIWKSEDGIKHYELPEQLTDLSEGEKLLISPLLLYVPLHHLQRGQIGCKGHVCCFEQNVSSICTELPRLPSDVSLIRVIKQYKDSDGQMSQKTFTIRRFKVMNALMFLKKHSLAFTDVILKESHLDWMGTNEEEDLPSYTHIDEIEETHQDHNDDLGPSTSQVYDVLAQQEYHEHVLGSVQKATCATPGTSNIADQNTILESASNEGR